jgi:hypothetical protein
VGLIFQRKIKRGGQSRDHHVPRRIKCQSVSAIISLPAKVSRVIQLRAVRVGSHEDGVQVSPLERWDQGILGIGKLLWRLDRIIEGHILNPLRIGLPDNPGIALRVNRHAGAKPSSAEAGRIGEGRLAGPGRIDLNEI